MDMYRVYYEVCKNHFEKAPIIIDPFHFVKLVTKANNNSRIRIMKNILRREGKSETYLLLKHRWKLFNQRLEKVSTKVEWNKYQKTYTSDLILLDKMINIHPELTKARMLLEDFYDIVHNSTYDEADKKLTAWIIEAKTSLIGEFREAADSLEKWLPEICNSFKINPETNSRYSSAFIEGTNNYIKVVKRVSYGFRCFNTFKNKILYHHNHSRHLVKG